MLAGELYDASDPELQADIRATQKWLARYNAARSASPAERRALLSERLAAVGEERRYLDAVSLRLRLQYQAWGRRLSERQLRDPRRC